MLDRWADKPVLASRPVDDMEGRGRWVVREGNPRLEYTRERCIDGEQALRQTVSLVDSTHLRDPANRTPWDSFCGDQGGLTCVALEFDGPQDWSEWNRLSLWVYIHPSRNPNVSFALDLVNGTGPEGTLTHSRETNPAIPQGRWVQVLWEIDYFPRDSILRFEICQTCTGFDPEMGEPDVTLDFDALELQRVEPGAFADLQRDWDLLHDSIKLNLVVSGSIYRMMNKLFRDRHEPLYGRQTEFLKLMPFSLSTLSSHSGSGSWLITDICWKSGRTTA